MRTRCLFAFTTVVFLVLLSTTPAPAQAVAPATRTFQFTYAGTVTDLRPGQRARVWLPVPPSNDDQEASIISQETPGKATIERESLYGNRILYFEAPADERGNVSFKIAYKITRREVKEATSKPGNENKPLIERLLKPDTKVPIDGKPLELLKDTKLPVNQVETARVLYDLVNRHMRYSKDGTGWGNGDAVWACDSRRGNCSDFHSLFIALARSQKIPSIFEIGFPLPEKRGTGEVSGYHCWAKFKPAGKGWVPVDISEANQHPKMKDYFFGHLTADRVAFSSGRDLVLVPKQDGPALNFFVHPYVEGDGKPLGKERIKPRYTFKDE